MGLPCWNVEWEPLDGQNLRRAVVSPRTGATELEFDLGARLRLSGSVAPDGEIYSIYKPRGLVLVVRIDGSFSHEHATHRERWRPILAAPEPRLAAVERGPAWSSRCNARANHRSRSYLLSASKVPAPRSPT